MELSHNHPVYTIGVVANLLGLHVQTIRQYEREGLVCPCRTIRKTRLYSPADVERLESITYLVKTCGVNLAGVRIVVTLSTVHPEVEELLRSKGIVPRVAPAASPSQDLEEKSHGVKRKPKP